MTEVRVVFTMDRDGERHAISRERYLPCPPRVGDYIEGVPSLPFALVKRVTWIEGVSGWSVRVELAQAVEETS